MCLLQSNARTSDIVEGFVTGAASLLIIGTFANKSTNMRPYFHPVAFLALCSLTLSTFVADAQTSAKKKVKTHSTYKGKKAATAPKAHTGTMYNAVDIAPPPVTTPSGTSGASADGIFTYVEQQPEFKGSLRDYLAQNLNYPEAARAEGDEGKVYVKFIVTAEGFLKGAEVIKSSGYTALDAEALRVINGMNPPDGTTMWKPGKNNGQAVNTYFTLPFVFHYR